LGRNADGDGIYLPCEQCVIHKLNALAEGEFGDLLRAAVGWREVMDLGVGVSLQDIPADELITLQLLEQIYPQNNGRKQRNQPGDPIGQPGCE
jgi:hypothetical protein